MPTILVSDATGQLGVSSPFNLSYPGALALLAQATSPSPGSRYRPASHWAVAKYLTVCDPRRRKAFTVNPGIYDLDPHQKTVLSDDIGMAIALGLIDQSHGIRGIADVYALHSAGRLTLNTAGRHRKMPDFVLDLRIPIAGSHVVLLECKGSTTRGHYASQVASACNTQLANVNAVRGINANTIPKLGAATELVPGRRLTIYLDDPPEQFNESLSEELQANLLALEYSLFGDSRSANEVWKTYGLPTFTGARGASSLPTSSSTKIQDDAVSPLGRQGKFDIEPSGVFEAMSDNRLGYASTRIELKMSKAAKAARTNRQWASALQKRATMGAVKVAVPTLLDEQGGNERRIEEEAITSTAIAVRATTRVWYQA